MEDWTIVEEFTLPSKGKLYTKPVDADVKLRSMTTEEEMKRLGRSPYVYKMFSDMIDDCIISKKDMSVYDMCLADYQFLLYKLRIVTYGSEYRVKSVCPICGKINDVTVDLDSLKLKTYDESLKKSMEFELPVSKKLIKLKWQTPRIIDETEKQIKEHNSLVSDTSESAVLFNVMAVIDTIDGVEYDDTKKELFVRKLPMRDTNMILQRSKKLLTSMGLDTDISHTCAQCNQDYTFSLPITGEFFGPTDDLGW